MANRFFALVHATANARAEVATRIQGRSDLAVALDRPECVVIHEATACAIPVLDRGTILGPLFMTGRRQRQTALAPEDAILVHNTVGEFLPRAFWGGYVALLVGETSVAVLRAPFGELPCLAVRTPTATLLASDVAMLTTLGNISPRVDRDATARFLAAPDTRSGETCLAGVEELRGGERLILRPGGATTENMWSPWDHAAGARRILDPVEATARLRDTILSSVATRCSEAGRIAVMLSGGLDSSVLAAAATAGGLEVIGVNVTTSDAAGDERRYARMTAAETGLALVERSLDVHDVDLARSSAATLPRPSTRAFWSSARHQARRVAAENHAPFVATGGGGDNIFCSLQSVSPLLDCRLDIEGRTEFWRVARTIAELTGSDMLTVLRRAWLRSWQPHRQVTDEIDPSFLSAIALTAVHAASRHPWRRRPRHIPPGKGAHVALLVGTQGLAEDGDPLAETPILYPLLSQPIVETCLRIPSWRWFDRGCNRAAARHAFSPLLPAEVAWRRSKGSPDGFVVQLYETNRRLIRAMLLDGKLAGFGLLDVDAIARALDGLGPASGTDHGRIMRLVDVETWSRCWPG
ncbi:asparagine synthase-related protein [Sphingomonas immobilis]|uniref:asparagine synthase (glutamine-hydrolyzing) n=1 Tax=Sphingomonas immobilis TaxID=3063997 RepID=A0ABT9A191_9SPHN|nr:asparagine synthase-related protein [Sphingomonas sp. CA1-15]MDO7843593.1 asparagine synthase-related protein [Sphingomonas sp. CA1-15]